MARGMASRSWRVLALCACMAAGLVLALIRPLRASDQPSPASNTPAKIVEFRIDGEIEPVLAEFVDGAFKRAERDHDDLILITINTPGGLDSSMRAIIHNILTSKIPVAIYVSPTGSRAASAGFFILLSADVAAMSPGTEAGAASPVFLFGGQTVQVDETMHKKVVNDATAYLRSFVSARGRNTDLAATAVTEAKAFSAQEALDGKLIDLIVSSPEELLSKLDGRTVTRLDGSKLQLSLVKPTVYTLEMSARERFLSRIVQPDVFFILLIIGVLGLYTEFTHPGLFAPGVIGGISMVLALFAMHMLPVNFAGFLLIVLALGLFVLEAKFPTHGVLGVGGVVAMVLGALMLVRSPLTGRGVSLSTALVVVIPFAVIVIILARLVLKSRSWKVSTGKEELLGEMGEVRESLDGSGDAGMVFIHGELWRAKPAHGQPIPLGARVRVVKVTGLTLEVEAVGQL
jgi:membrane-bound serine protease (ClpP class)